MRPGPEEQPTIVEWIEALSSREMSPAAGSAAAIAGALGVALLMKLARRTPPESISGYEDLIQQLAAARDRLLALAEADAWATRAWASTHRRHEDDEERTAALQMLIEVPLEAAELCRTVRLAAQPLLETGHPPARPDGQVGVELLQTSQRGMCRLAQENVASLRDPSQIRRVGDRLGNLRED